LYELLQRDQPRHAAAPYYLGRLAMEMGQLDEALRQFERAKTLSGAEQYPLDHRLGDAFADRAGPGDKAQARAAYERFIKQKRANPKNVEDARKALAKLG
jgi:tetratricopeptide (TPR) repeat protein